jgi:hypothetical protein
MKLQIATRYSNVPCRALPSNMEAPFFGGRDLDEFTLVLLPGLRHGR